MKLFLAVTCFILMSVSAGVAHATETIILKNLRANVEIIPENRSDIVASVDANGSVGSLPTVSRAGNVVTIEGAVQTGHKAYRVSFNLDQNMDLRELKRLSHVAVAHPSALPLIVIHTPLKFKLRSNAYVFGHIAPSQSIEIVDNGDGEWRIDPVSQDVSVSGVGGTNFYLSTSKSAAIDLMGTGNATIGDTQSLYSIQWGSGDVTVDKIYHDSDITISGIGDFNAKYVSGVMRILITDAGNTSVQDGDVTKLSVRTIDGVGGVRFGGTVKDVDVNIGTSTKVVIHNVTGKINKKTRQLATLEVENTNPR